MILSPEIGIILTKTPFAEAENPGNRDIQWDLPMFDLVNIFGSSTPAIIIIIIIIIIILIIMMMMMMMMTIIS